MNSETAFFLTKTLVPRRRPHVLRRSRLIDDLISPGEAMVTVIRAPAGYGKTTLLIDLAHESAATVCWLSLDEWDQDILRFLQYLGMALTRHSGVRLPRRVGRGDTRSFLARISGEIATMPGNVWVILDDVHSIESSNDVVAHIDYFAQRLPTNAALFLASRTQPTLPSLARIRLDGRLIEISPSDLAFNSDEIDRYYSLARQQVLTPERIEHILDVTQGWPAGVALLDEPGGAMDAPPAPTGHLGEYLASEVIGRLPEYTGKFLLWTSVLDVLEPNICDALMGEQGSADLLADLEKRNVPIMRIQTRIAMSCRLHPLVRDFLTQQLQSRSPDLYHRLQCQAGELMSQTHRQNQAIRHFAEAEEWEKVKQLIATEAPVAYGHGRWRTFMAWMELLPEHELATAPQLQVWRVRVLVRMGRADEALRIIEGCMRSPISPDMASRADLEALRSAAFRLRGDLDRALESARQALDLAMTANAPIDTVANARQQLAMTLFTRGSYAESEHELRPVLDICEQRGNVEDAAIAGACLGSALASLGRLPEAIVHLEAACERWRKLRNNKELSWTLNNLAMVHTLMGQTAVGRDLFGEALTRARAAGYPRAEAYALVSLADIERKSGALRTAVDTYSNALRACRDLGELTLATHALCGRSDAWRISGDSEHAEGDARQALASAEERASAYEQALARVALGRLAGQRGDAREALTCLALAATQFEKAGAPRELAESLFLLSDALLPARRQRARLNEVLGQLANVTRELGYDSFLLDLIRESPGPAEYGAARRIAGGFYRDLIRRSSPRRADREAESPKGTAQRGLPMLEIKSFGTFETRIDGRLVRNVEWESEKSKELVLLLLTRREPLARDEIITALWPDGGGSRARSAFHSTLYRVRQALYRRCIVESGGTYAVNPAGVLDFDVRHFRDLVDAAGTADKQAPQYVDILRQAVELYAGPFAPAIDSDWAMTVRLRLEDAFLDIAHRLADKLLEQERHQEARDVCAKLLEHDPYSERACYRLMKAAAAVGDAESALRAYKRHSDLLRIELGESPGESMELLHRQLRQQLSGASSGPP